MNNENSNSPEETSIEDNAPTEQVHEPEPEHNQESHSDYSTEQHIEYPNLIKKLGVWPVNIGLFFFYNNVVSLVVILVGLAIMYQTGVTDQRIISEKLGGLSVISSLITLGLTLIYSRKFYFSRHL